MGVRAIETLDPSVNGEAQVIDGTIGGIAVTIALGSPAMTGASES
jgi:hypothetical protein